MQDADRMMSLMKKFEQAKERAERAHLDATAANNRLQWATLDVHELQRQMDNAYIQFKGISESESLT